MPGPAEVHRWGRFETAVEAPLYDALDPLRDVRATADFTSPSGAHHAVPGFWDGEYTWRFRFAPGELGRWEYALRVDVRPEAPVTGGETLTAVSGDFRCVPYSGDNPLYRFGPPRMSAGRRHLVHAGTSPDGAPAAAADGGPDGLPFFWLADTVWNGPMLATPEEWGHFLRVRREQGFSAAQFVSTHWRTAPEGGPGGLAYTGGERLERVRPEFFRRLDARLDETAEAGIVGVPVLLWAIAGGVGAERNPGHILSEEDCALLAGYQVARWQAHPVAFILNGDGRYTGEHAPRWQRIGRAVFGATDPRTRPPVAVHPGGQQWVGEEFGPEPWLDILGYQSGHGGNETAWRWLVDGPPARRWTEVPRQAVINLEPCYEHHNRMAAQRGDASAPVPPLPGSLAGAAAPLPQSVAVRHPFPGRPLRGLDPGGGPGRPRLGRGPRSSTREPSGYGAPGGRFSPADVRRALYWSLLVAPTAGVTYGGHGVWGWDDGTAPPVAHERTGVPLPWREALTMPGAQEVRHLVDAFGAVPWWTLRPDPALLRDQPGPPPGSSERQRATPEGVETGQAGGEGDVSAWIVAARSEDGDLAVLYLPQGGTVALDAGRLAPGLRPTWVNPRDGSRQEGPALSPEGQLQAPDGQDWLLVLQ